MNKSLMSLLAAVLAASLLGACAPLQPVPFELATGKAVSQGYFYPENHALDVRIGEKLFTGYYIVATSTAYAYAPAPSFRRWGFAGDTTTLIASNQARASLAADDGEKLSCDLLLEGNRAVGECKSSLGTSYQLSTRAGVLPR